MKKPTYRNILHYQPLKLHTVVLNKFMEKNPIALTHKVVDKSSLMGIEVEVEQVPEPPFCGPFWACTEDGSLRNFGREYISLPIRNNQIEYALRYLFESLKKSSTYEFTPRCSVHVHMNARYMTKAQLRNFMLIYLIFERMLFKFVGQDREDNIHCVPLLDVDLTSTLFDVIDLERPPKMWLKYTAVNLIPLSSLGTIEFRHMHGTDDIDKLMTWINIIQAMKLYAYKQDVPVLRNEIFSLNTNSQYRQFAINIFGELAQHLINDDNYYDCFQMMEEGVIAAKVCSEGQAFRKKLTISPETQLGKMLYPQQNTRTKKEKVISHGLLNSVASLSPMPPNLAQWSNENISVEIMQHNSF